MRVTQENITRLEAALVAGWDVREELALERRRLEAYSKE